jgi:peptide/nickel transport system permease protein
VSNNQAVRVATQLKERPQLWRRFSRHRLGLLGLGMLLVLAAASIVGPVLIPYDPYGVDLSHVGMPPSTSHWLGTDLVGRDVLVRLLSAGRVSLSVGLVSVAIYLSIAIVLGGVAGYYRGWLDNILMRFTETVMCFPTLVVIIAVVSIVGPSVYNVMLIIGLLAWPWSARLVRGQFLYLRELDFVLAARCLGVPSRRIIFRHILPNTVGPIIVNATFGVAWTILLEAALSFLGVGVQPPMPSWGNMLNAAKAANIIENMPWLWVPPGLMVAACVLSINFMGDGLRDAMDPRSTTE